MNEQKDKNERTAQKATLVLADGNRIVLELNTEQAPISAANFIDLARKGFYNQLTFHRVIKGFMIQGGCPTGTGTGGPGYSIKGEFRSNGVPNNIRHLRGVISMARSAHPDSAGSQFFIVHQDAPHLDGEYAAFGQVIEGMEIVDQIASVPTDYQDRPVQKQVIQTVLIEGDET
ncbi:MAG: peptidylprolyl isomerase [Clostridiaceae bacterium]|jgi:peptidyl-prolyl cis-trans isomerase B (cyclophilin B)|nr:peptidylprolyl isomerase [Eubacteriales bacterium]NLV48446.1 peptidylprolyl isomerase [Clostridiaceae bacterium]